MTRLPYSALLPLLPLVSFACSGTEAPGGPALISRLDKEIPTRVADGNSPSTQVAVVRGGEVAWSRAYGKETSTSHAYMCASVQKCFTAAAVLQLAERGKLDLDGDVGLHLPFPYRHPGHPDTPITVRTLLAHRSGLVDLRHQFAWDTGSTFSQEWRPACPDRLAGLPLGGFLRASLTPGGANYDPGTWRHDPGERYAYSVSAYTLLRYLIGRVSEKGYPRYMRENIFAPLGMTRTDFTNASSAGPHTTPHTRRDGKNIPLPSWQGQGWMMHTTAADLAQFLIALIHDGRHGETRLLQPASITAMRRLTTSFKFLFKGSDDLPRRGHGLGHYAFRAGWYGNGGSAPGFQCLFRYHPQRKVGYAILTNVNAILTGGPNYATARADIYRVQDGLMSILDPTFPIRSRGYELTILVCVLLASLTAGTWIRRRRKRQAR